MRTALIVSATTMALLGSSTAIAATTEPDATTEYHFAVIGDLPYGQDQFAKLPAWVASINADQDVQKVIHLGDTKSGGDKCSNEWNDAILTQFNAFDTPLIYTPGDNEWTDCHRTSNGSYNPLERLSAIKKTYFATPGETLGAETMRVQFHPFQHENVKYRKHNVMFATAHIVGSNNGSMPWKGLGHTTETPEQKWERRLRTFHAVEWINTVFREAARNNDRAVVLSVHADMFYKNNPSDKYNSEFTPIVRQLAHNAIAFGKPVYLLNGDTHTYRVNKPLTEGSAFMEYYGVQEVPNLTRIQVDGSKNANNWLKVTINPGQTDDVLRWEQVPFND